MSENCKTEGRMEENDNLSNNVNFIHSMSTARIIEYNGILNIRMMHNMFDLCIRNISSSLTSLLCCTFQLRCQNEENRLFRNSKYKNVGNLFTFSESYRTTWSTPSQSNE